MNCWYAIYTKTNAEQKLVKSIVNLAARNNERYDTYLPMKTEIRRCNNKVSTKRVPVFKNYLFVSHDNSAFSKLKYLPGFNYYVSAGVKPSGISNAEMQIIKNIAENAVNISCNQKITKSTQPAIIIDGPLTGQPVRLLSSDEKRARVEIELKNLSTYIDFELPSGVIQLDNLVAQSIKD